MVAEDSGREQQYRKSRKTKIGRGLECPLTPTPPPPLLGLLRLKVDRLERNYGKGGGSDLSRCSRVSSVELQYLLGCMYFGSILPTTVLRTITFPLDLEFEPPAEHLAVQDFLH